MITVKIMERMGDWAYERGFGFLVLTAVSWLVIVPVLLIVDVVTAIIKGLVGLSKT